MNCTALIQQDGEWWLGWVQEIPGVNAQERSRERLIESLGMALRDVIAANRTLAREEARQPGDLEEVALTA